MTKTRAAATGVDDGSLRSLRGWNLALTLLHLGQAVAVLVLASDFAVTVTRSLPSGPPGTPSGSPEALFDLPVGAAVAVFLALAAADHLLTATVFRRASRSARRSTWCSAWWRSRRWRGRSSRARWPPERRYGAAGSTRGAGQPTRSNTAASPWPPPMHMVSSA